MTETYDPFWKSEEDAFQYDKFERIKFARVYPVIADQILERTGIRKGSCLDAGSGPALLAIALALLSDLRVTALDSSPEMYDLARKNIRDRCMEDLVAPVIGDIHAIPAADATFNLVVSRGSFHSWKNLPVAFLEIIRVLRPYGMAYIGGGYGNARIRDEVFAGHKERWIVNNPVSPVKTRFRKYSVDEVKMAIGAAGISDYRIISDDSGFWIVIRKNEEQKNSPENPLQFHDGFFFTK